MRVVLFSKTPIGVGCPLPLPAPSWAPGTAVSPGSCSPVLHTVQMGSQRTPLLSSFSLPPLVMVLRCQGRGPSHLSCLMLRYYWMDGGGTRLFLIISSFICTRRPDDILHSHAAPRETSADHFLSPWGKKVYLRMIKTRSQSPKLHGATCPIEGQRLA